MSTHRSKARASLFRKTAPKLAAVSLAAIATAVGAQTTPPGSEEPAAGATATVADSATEEEIVVTGQRGSQERALRVKQTAIGVVDVAAADEIGRLPDRNVAEVIERLPGVGVLYDQGEGRFVSVRGVPSALNNYTINGFEIGNPDGQTRALPLDVISGQLLNRVEVVKVKTADLDAQGIGGTINLVTQTAFDFRDRFVVQASAQAGYQELDADSVPIRGDVSVGGRFGGGEQFGVIVGASYSDRTYRSNGLFPDDWQVVPQAARGGLPINNKFTEYQLRRERIGATASFDFRPSDNHQFYVRGLYSRFTEDEYRQRYRLDFLLGGNAQALIRSGALVLSPDGVTGTSTATERRQDLRQEYKEKSVLTGTVGGLSRFGPWAVEYGVNRVHNEVREPNQLWQFRGNPGIVDLDFSDVLFRATPRTELTAAQLQFRQYTEQNERGDEDIWQGRVDLRRDLGLGRDSWIKVGAKYRTTDKSFDAENTVYTRGATAATRFTLGQFDLAGETFLVRPRRDRVYVSTPTIDLDKIRAFTDERLGGPLFVLDANATRVNGALGDLDLEENVAAGYATANFDLGDVSITPGVRVERAELQIAGFTLTNGTMLAPASARSRRTDVLPSLILRWRPTNAVVFRASYNRSLGRPEYISLTPGGSLNSVDLTASLGNPDLKPFVSDAVDVSAEWYFARGGLLSLGAFGKRIANPIFTSAFTVFDAEFAGQSFSQLRFSQPQNADRGEIVGIELAYKQQFTFLPGLFSGFGIDANVTLTDSSIRLPTGRRTTFQGQADLLYGAQLFYQSGPVEASVAFHHTGSFIVGLGPDSDTDQFSDTYERLDAKLNIAVTPNAGIFFEAQNLTDEPTRFYQSMRTDWITQHERYGRTFYAGASVKF